MTTPDLEMLQAELERLGVVNRELTRAVRDRDATIKLLKEQLVSAGLRELAKAGA